MNIKEIKFDDIEFSKLDFVKTKGRINIQLFYSLDNKMVWKIWGKEYEWSNCVELGIDNTYYDELVVPNFYAIIKDSEGHNRGYVSYMVSSDQYLSNYKKIFSRKTLADLIVRKITLRDTLKLKNNWNKNALSKLAYIILSRAVKTKTIYTDFNFSNLWVEKENYYLINLESLKEFNWFFGKDCEHPDYLAQVIYRHNFNENINILFDKHGLIVPMKINSEKEIYRFWKKFVYVNKLENLPIEL